MSGWNALFTPIIDKAEGVVDMLATNFVTIGGAVIGISLIIRGGKALINFVQRKLRGAVR